MMIELACRISSPEILLSKYQSVANHELKGIRAEDFERGQAKQTSDGMIYPSEVRKWIEQGAKWQKHWSLIAPQRPAVPAVQRQDWGRNDIDRFILARLEREGLTPAAEADKTTLILEVRRGETNGSINRNGQFQAEIVQTCAAVRERHRVHVPVEHDVLDQGAVTERAAQGRRQRGRTACRRACKDCAIRSCRRQNADRNRTIGPSRPICAPLS